MSYIWQLMRLRETKFVDKRLEMTVGELKKHIDGLTYFELLWAWRHSDKNDPYFVNEIGEHFKKVMALKRSLLMDHQIQVIESSVGKGRYRGNVNTAGD